MRRMAMSMSCGSTELRRCMRAWASDMRIMLSRWRTATGMACVMPASLRSSVYTCTRASALGGMRTAVLHALLRVLLQVLRHVLATVSPRRCTWVAREGRGTHGDYIAREACGALSMTSPWGTCSAATPASKQRGEASKG